jgi:hypothetical protein
MKRLKFIIVITFLLFMSGCSDFVMICSLNPFYLDKNMTLVNGIEGSWKASPLRPKNESNKEDRSDIWREADTTATWKIERVINHNTHKTKKGKDSIAYTPQNYYMVNLIGNQPDSLKYHFKMVLFRVNKILYADFMPVDYTGMQKSRFAEESFFSVHTLARVVMRNKQIGFSWLGDEYMKEMIEKKRVRVDYKWVQSAKRLLLVGTPEKLTGMIERYASETRFIDWDNQKAMLKLNRIK